MIESTMSSVSTIDQDREWKLQGSKKSNNKKVIPVEEKSDFSETD